MDKKAKREEIGVFVERVQASAGRQVFQGTNYLTIGRSYRLCGADNIAGVQIDSLASQAVQVTYNQFFSTFPLVRKQLTLQRKHPLAIFLPTRFPISASSLKRSEF